MAERRGFNIPPPDRGALDEKITQIRSKISSLQEKLDTLQSNDMEDDKSKGIRAERQKIQSGLDDLQKKFEGLRDLQQQRRLKINEIDKTKQDLRKQNQELSRNLPTTAAEIEAEIRRLEWKLETEGSSSVKREKTTMAEIARLKNARANVRQRDGVQAVQGNLDDERRMLMDEVTTTQHEIEVLRAEKNKLYADLQELQKKQGEGRDAIDNIRKEKGIIREEINQCYAEIKTLRDEFSAQMDEWRKKREEAKEQERIKREAEFKAREERRAKIQEERRVRDEYRMRQAKEFSKLKKLNPHEDEIASCENLIAYLSNDSKEHEKKKVVAEFDANAFAKKGMQVLKKDRAEEDLWLMGKKKDKSKDKKPAKPAAADANGAAPPPSKPKVDRKLPALTVSKLQAFQAVGVNPPLRSSEIPACLEELKQKKLHFESFRKTMEEVEREEAEEARQAEQARLRKMREDEEEKERAAEEEEDAEDETANQAADDTEDAELDEADAQAAEADAKAVAAIAAQAKDDEDEDEPIQVPAQTEEEDADDVPIPVGDVEDDAEAEEDTKPDNKGAEEEEEEETAVNGEDEE